MNLLARGWFCCFGGAIRKTAIEYRVYQQVMVRGYMPDSGSFFNDRMFIPRIAKPAAQ